MIELKNDREIKIMMQGGHILSAILRKLIKDSKSGVKLVNLDKRAKLYMAQSNVRASFLAVKNYKWHICTCPNDVVVHGIPNNYVLREGDILGIDIGLIYNRLHTDTAWTIKIKGDEQKTRKENHKIDRFLDSGKTALFKAIAQAKVGNNIGHISKAIQDTIEQAGYSVVKGLVGHGIGKRLHEDPPIPCFLNEEIEKTPKLVPGMVLAIEVIYNQGSSQISFENDGWTVRTKDCGLSALFEHTIAITKNKTLVLTA